MTPEEGLDAIMSDSALVIKRSALALHSDLIRVAPVDTGYFKSAWRIEQRGAYVWRIGNNADYATVLARGRRRFTNFSGNNQMFGSTQWAEGLSPMLQKTDKEIEEALDAISY